MHLEMVFFNSFYFNKYNELFSGIDFKCLPPCEKVLTQKLLRTHMLTNLLKEAQHQFIQIDFTSGWNVEDSKLRIKYYEDEAYPADISQIVNTDVGESDDEDDDYISDEDENSDIYTDSDDE